MKATTIVIAGEGSNKNEHFSDKLSVANMPPLFYEQEYKPWERTGKVNPILDIMYKQP